MFSQAENLRFYGTNSFNITTTHQVGESKSLNELLRNLDDDLITCPR